MTHCVRNQCRVRSSKVGAKGFHYPGPDTNVMRVKSGVRIEFLNFLVDREFADWLAVVIENEHVEGAPIKEGKGVYWILRKNVM